MADTPLRRLELTYEVENLSRRYEEGTIPWPYNAEFRPINDFKGSLRIWEDCVEPEQIWETRTKLLERKESCHADLRYYLNSRNLAFRGNDHPTYFFDEKKEIIRAEEEARRYADFLRGETPSYSPMFGEPISFLATDNLTHLPIPLPDIVPIPADLHRIAEILMVADEQDNYPDLMLKLAYLVLEEMKVKSDIDKYARDFVSHPFLGWNVKAIEFIARELPSAKIMIDGKAAVQFNRNDPEHKAFVTKFAQQARQKAKELFETKVKQTID